MRVVVITGGGSGIGAATATQFISRGDRVYNLSRSKGQDTGAIHVPTDVTMEESVRSAISHVIEAEGRIDVLVVNAGFGISGPIEETPLESAKRQFDVNYFGAFLTAREVLPHMRERGSGHICFISSVGGIAALPFQSFYSASKSAVNVLALALRNEVMPFGIRVYAVMPGDVRTGFTANRQKLSSTGVYAEALKRSVEGMERDEINGMSPDRIARRIYRLSRRRSPKPLSSVGISYRLLSTLIFLLPKRLVNYIISKLYA